MEAVEPRGAGGTGIPGLSCGAQAGMWLRRYSSSAAVPLARPGSGGNAQGSGLRGQCPGSGGNAAPQVFQHGSRALGQDGGAGRTEWVPFQQQAPANRD